jgi:cytochrome b6-f complex iron-sulfur subunit
MITERNDSDRPAITPQQYEVLHGGGAEAAEIAKQRLSRRRFMRRSMLAVWGLSATASVAGALYMLYPNLAGQFGGQLALGKKSDFPAGEIGKFAKDSAGVFYHQEAKSYIMHLSPSQTLLLHGQSLTDQLDSENFVKDSDGSLWAALYQKCVHLGCTVPYRDDCQSFKCPCHGSHYNTDGEYIDGPAPRSLDRFALSFSGGQVMVDTSTTAAPVPHPDPTTRILPIPNGGVCSAS